MTPDPQVDLSAAGRAGSEAWSKCMADIMSTGKVAPNDAVEYADNAMAHAVLAALGNPHERPCEYVVTDRDGTSYCSLNQPTAPRIAELELRLRNAEKERDEAVAVTGHLMRNAVLKLDRERIQQLLRDLKAIEEYADKALLRVSPGTDAQVSLNLIYEAARQAQAPDTDRRITELGESERIRLLGGLKAIEWFAASRIGEGYKVDDMLSLIVDMAREAQASEIATTNADGGST